jgi:tRNA-dihydrouridine synthase 4
LTCSVLIHNEHSKTTDFIDSVLGHPQSRNIDFLTIHPRTRSTPSTEPINLDALSLLVERYGSTLPILVSGDVFDLRALPYTSNLSPIPALTDEDGHPSPSFASPVPSEPLPQIPQLAGLMAARGLLANPALFAGAPRCPWAAVAAFLRRAVRAPLPFKLALHHVGEMCGPGCGPDRAALLKRRDRSALMACRDMCELIDFVEERMPPEEGAYEEGKWRCLGISLPR